MPVCLLVLCEKVFEKSMPLVWVGLPLEDMFVLVGSRTSTGDSHLDSVVLIAMLSL